MWTNRIDNFKLIIKDRLWGELAVSYLLSAELLHHRLKSLLSPPTAPAETAQTECKQPVQENIGSTHKRTREHAG